MMNYALPYLAVFQLRLKMLLFLHSHLTTELVVHPKSPSLGVRCANQSPAWAQNHQLLP